MSREELPRIINQHPLFAEWTLRHGSSYALKVGRVPDICPPKPSVPAPVGTTILFENMANVTCGPESPLMRATEVEGLLKCT